MTKEEAKHIVVDCISREAVDTLVDELARAISDERCCMSRGRSTASIMQDILDLPSVQPKADQEPKPKIFKTTSFTLKPETMEKYRREIVRQMEDGVVLLPNCIELVEDKSDLLDKIRAEMEDLASHKIHPISFEQAVAVDMCINIIDKYRKEE